MIALYLIRLSTSEDFTVKALYMATDNATS